MESKGSVRSGNKADAKTAGLGKPEKPSSGSTATTDKKETSSKEPSAPVTNPVKKGAPAANESSMLNDHSNIKPSPAASEGAEAAARTPADSEHQGNNTEESPGGGCSIFENMKPLIVFGGVAVAAIAVIVGVAILARKK
nr:cell cycle exit and neuronal differentiation protein 1 [Anolis sagrei ordinatus]XP_060625275.1 cell cycle exit and neuronal differentiation protein 1 [Anolis sagrei ordinatus]